MKIKLLPVCDARIRRVHLLKKGRFPSNTSMKWMGSGTAGTSECLPKDISVGSVILIVVLIRIVLNVIEGLSAWLARR